MKKTILTLTFASCLLTAPVCLAQVESSAIMSPSCNEEQIREIAGSALISISKNQSWGNEVKGYIIALDTSKLSYGDLIKKMQDKNCFN